MNNYRTQSYSCLCAKDNLTLVSYFTVDFRTEAPKTKSVNLSSRSVSTPFAHKIHDVQPVQETFSMFSITASDLLLSVEAAANVLIDCCYSCLGNASFSSTASNRASPFILVVCSLRFSLHLSAKMIASNRFQLTRGFLG